MIYHLYRVTIHPLVDSLFHSFKKNIHSLNHIFVNITNWNIIYEIRSVTLQRLDLFCSVSSVLYTLLDTK